MSIALGRRIRWALVAILVAAWFAALAVDVGGNGVHLLLAGAVAILLYELVAVETPS
jgi:branched-subunit amino acid transport protein AzlD